MAVASPPPLAILIAAIGQAEIFKTDRLKPDATVIDVRINRVAAPENGKSESKLVGDVAFAECKRFTKALSSVTGGVDAIKIAVRMANIVSTAFRRAGPVAPTS